jgi:hypothetical protein
MMPNPLLIPSKRSPIDLYAGYYAMPCQPEAVKRVQKKSLEIRCSPSSAAAKRGGSYGKVAARALAGSHGPC